MIFADSPVSAKTVDAPAVNSRGWNGLRWDGAEVVILASGESLSVEQSEAARVWRDAVPERKAIVINTSFRRALWADVLYACDTEWWDGRDRTDMPTYLEEARKSFAGDFWTQANDAAAKHRLNFIHSQPGNGLCRHVGKIHQGANSGYQAIGLAYWAGARRVYLLGYDMRGGHWHGQHPSRLQKQMRFDIFLNNFATLAVDVAKEPHFEVINCTPGSSLKAFPMLDWREIFA